MRDLLLKFAFGSSKDQLSSSVELCQRLADNMDGRNKSCLLLLSLHESATATHVEAVLWMFPYDRVIQRTGGKVDLNDAFSLSSGLRKAASFAGANNRAGFLSGLALDQQSSSVDQKVAQFWIGRFLNGQLQVQSREGTDLLANAFRATNKSLKNDEAAQQHLVAAVAHVRSNSSKPWTLEDVSNAFPAGAARDAFDKATGSGPETRTPFIIDLPRLDSRIRFRVFKLDNGITVAAPFLELGPGSGIELAVSAAGTKLTASGLVESETIRSTS